MSTHQVKHTPLMEQYFEIKAAYPNMLLLFQVGDFYELFFDDAKTAAAFLGITLTARGKSEGDPIPLCGVPVHTKDHYIAKLVKGGFNVALCDQLEPPRPGTVVKRGVTQVLTPGTLTDAHLLDAKSSSYLLSFFPMADQWGLLFGELLTAQLHATVIKAGDERALEAELSRFLPDEIVLPAIPEANGCSSFFKRAAYCVTPITPCAHDRAAESNGNSWMSKQFDTTILTTLEKQESLKLALYYFYTYIERNQPSALDQFKSINLYQTDDFLILDQATQRTLEIVKDATGSRKFSLYAALDGAITGMGSRMIKKWLLRPLIKSKAIIQRYDVVDLFVHNVMLKQQITDLLSQIGDCERVIGRIALRRALLSDYLVLMHTLALLPTIRTALYPHTTITLIAVIYEHLKDFTTLHQLLQASLNDDASKDWFIKAGFDHHLDQLRELVHHSNTKIVAMEQAEQHATGIASLKIRYNQVHGYYIEITNTHRDSIPARYMRQQTLVGRERYTTPELQELQYEIVDAQTNIEQVEKRIFERVKSECAFHMHTLRKVSHAIAHLDACIGLAHIAYTHNYVRPTFNEQRHITITQGRHPVVERSEHLTFIPNDTLLAHEQSLLVITGPNMGGKSTYLRQVALISILAQSGSFVPAAHANLSLVDRIFTRIGAGDNVSEGKSTFLMEMEETAAICAYATEKSLVILDEVGRGTSTYDGLALAQAVVEYIATHIQALCLFATHYQELTLLQETVPGIKNYYAASAKTKDGIVFLYKIMPGIADGSFGIEVAKLASLPPQVISRAQQLLTNFTTAQANTPHYTPATSLLDPAISSLQKEITHLHTTINKLETQLAKYQTLETIDFDLLSPKQAFDILWNLKK